MSGHFLGSTRGTVEFLEIGNGLAGEIAEVAGDKLLGINVIVRGVV
jgi:hypothetical protein